MVLNSASQHSQHGDTDAQGHGGTGFIPALGLDWLCPEWKTASVLLALGAAESLLRKPWLQLVGGVQRKAVENPAPNALGRVSRRGGLQALVV